MKIAILTAVDKEYETIRNLFSNERIGSIKECVNGAFYYEIVPVSINCVDIDVIIGISDQGNVEASISVNDILRKFNPDLFFFAGTCGGIKDVEIGDSIIATKVFDIFRGKDSDIWYAKPIDSGMDSKNLGLCKSVMMSVNRGEKLSELYKDSNNKLHMGFIGSSSAIVASEKSNIRKMIEKQYAHIIGIEMEGYGFYQTLEKNEYRSGIMIRAVTDDAKTKTQSQDDYVQPIGMNKVYYVIYELIHKYVQIETSKKSIEIKNEQILVPNEISQFYDNSIFMNLSQKHVFAGFLSFDLQSRSKELFHLGHAYFVKFVDALLKANQKVVIYVCSSNSNFRDMDQKKYNSYCEVLNRLMTTWKRCFYNKVEIIDIGEEIRNIQFSDGSLEQQAEDYLNRIEGKFTKFFNKREIYTKMLSNLTAWRIDGAIDEKCKELLEETLEIHPSDVRGTNRIIDEEIYAISYILLKKPRWYSSEWMIKFINFFNNTMNRADEMKDIVIIESKRNSYSWLGMSFLAKKMKRVFPQMLFFNNIPDTKGKKYMNTDTPDFCITLDNYQNLSMETVDALFIKKMSILLGVGEIAVLDEIKSIMSECENRF